MNTEDRREKLLKDLEEISLLEENWDTYGAPEFSNQAIANARKLLEHWNYDTLPNTVTPTSNGTLSWEWVLPHGDASLEIGDNTFSFCTYPQVFNIEQESALRGGPFDELNLHELEALVGALA